MINQSAAAPGEKTAARLLAWWLEVSSGAWPNMHTNTVLVAQERRQRTDTRARETLAAVQLAQQVVDATRTAAQALQHLAEVQITLSRTLQTDNQKAAEQTRMHWLQQESPQG